MNLKKIGKGFTSQFVGTGPSPYKKKNLPGRGLTKVEKHWLYSEKVRWISLLAPLDEGVTYQDGLLQFLKVNGFDEP